MVNHDKTLEGLHMTDQNNQSENNPTMMSPAATARIPAKISAIIMVTAAPGK